MQTEKILINSVDRTALSNSSTDFTVILPKTYQKVKAVKLEAYALVNSAYTVNSSNNTFIFYEKTTQSVTPKTYTTQLTIPSMMYTTASLATAIQTLLNATSHFEHLHCYI